MRHRADNAIAGNGDDYNAMVAAASGDLSSPAALEEMEGFLDLTQFADYMLVNFYSGNADWAFQNWKRHPQPRRSGLALVFSTTGMARRPSKM